MVQRIIYPGTDILHVIICHDANGVSLSNLSISEVARKDVPAGVPFLLVNEADIPADRTYRAAWAADFSAPDGYGIGALAWFAEQAARAVEEPSA